MRVRIARANAAVLAGVLLLAAAGCTMVRLAYDNADRLLLSRLDSYINFSDEQRERVATVLDARLARHRSEELPQLAQLLRTASGAVAEGFDATDVDAVADEAEVITRELVDRSLPVLAVALQDLSDTQLDYLESNLADALQEFRKVYATNDPAKARLRNRALRAVELVEKWTGPLRPAQAKIVHTVRDSMPDGAGAWADFRAQRQASLLAMLRSRASAEDTEAFLRATILDLAGAPGEIVQMRKDINAGLRRLVLELNPTLDEEQRLHVAERLARFAADAEALAARAPAD